MTASRTIGGYLIEQLQGHGVDHVFGIPGDYVLSFFDLMARHETLDLINTCDEQGAGFAADAYARVRGLGAVCVTYCVGGLKIANTTAQAYAEKSPVVVISGAPGVEERLNNPMLHHKVKEFDTQLRVFKEFTVASALLDNPATAPAEIDRVIHAALRYKRPVYLELPRDMVTKECPAHHTHARETETSAPESLKEALSEAVSLINEAKRPVILAGVEIHRFGLQPQLLAFAQKTGIPVASTILGKSVISEKSPLYLGIYEGATGREEVREYVESSDCLIILGAFMTDLNLGVYTANIDPGRSIFAISERTSIKHHHYDDILFEEFIGGLSTSAIRPRTPDALPQPMEPDPVQAGNGNDPITAKRLFERLNTFIKDTTVVIADVGDTLFGANDLLIHEATEFLSPAYYASLGFAVPAAMGAQLANPAHRPLVLTGDGSFQMTGMELSTAALFKLNPIVIVLDNKGYSTERPMLDGPFNDIHPWNFSLVPELLSAGKGFHVNTEAQLERALAKAEAYLDGFTIIHVSIDRDDRSPALLRLSERLAKRVRK
ncbi:alpha-keto acid decarboxylase family protein [Desulfoluna spongiiphila]|uniref:Indolepyruvate decarboxylase n=1 Tax=Desulfoluna spongiiphila TaxID=419481 RepID=A0A1G5F9Y9_9BACT|nr:thiamine pyrophosphate-binding protein [Desulfoluna spongiiphila]SCY35458.1 indolepyruvate decarboxylase [Desulfoluna spongiiphila]VVS94231.1 thiamine pyrophosphate (tpp)-dependent enzyme [Desulfoluna spongiiphila]